MLVAALSSPCVTFTNNNLIEFERKNNTNKRQIFFVTLRFFWRIICLWFSPTLLIFLRASDVWSLFIAFWMRRPVVGFNKNSIFYLFGTSVAQRKYTHKSQVHEKSRSFVWRCSESPSCHNTKYCLRLHFIFYIASECEEIYVYTVKMVILESLKIKWWPF